MSTRSNLVCPEDAIIYNCSISSNHEFLSLRWRITLHDLMILDFTFDRENTNYSFPNITASLTHYRPDEYIESILVVNQMSIINIVECRFEDLNSSSTAPVSSGKYIILITRVRVVS